MVMFLRKEIKYRRHVLGRRRWVILKLVPDIYDIKKLEISIHLLVNKHKFSVSTLS